LTNFKIRVSVEWGGGAALFDCLMSTLNTFFSKSTYTIFDTKICLESAWHWLSILPFESRVRGGPNHSSNEHTHSHIRACVRILSSGKIIVSIENTVFIAAET
jgi:hypothetical protein